jgi:hypothetical protein
LFTVNIDHLQNEWPDWLPVTEESLGWFAVIVALSWVGTLVAVPALIARMPADYFSVDRRRPMYSEARHPVVGWTLVVLKNLLGLVLIVFGAIMLLTPGQGLLTILIGLLLVDFPGKYRLERWFVLRPGVLRTLNRFRARVGQPPLDPP